MLWKSLLVAADSTHHITNQAQPAYPQRFDYVLKFHAPGLAPVKVSAEAWHIYPNGIAAYPQRYSDTFGFYCQRASVSTQGAWYHIDCEGNPIYSEIYAWCGNFQENLCTVRTSAGKYLHIHLDGSPLYKELWQYAGDFKDAIAVVQSESGKSSHIDTQGRLIHHCWFDDLDVYHKGYARAKDYDGWFHINMAGKPNYNKRFQSIEPHYNGFARVTSLDGERFIINDIGDVLWRL